MIEEPSARFDLRDIEVGISCGNLKSFYGLNKNKDAVYIKIWRCTAVICGRPVHGDIFHRSGRGDGDGNGYGYGIGGHAIKAADGKSHATLNNRLTIRPPEVVREHLLMLAMKRVHI